VLQTPHGGKNSPLPVSSVYLYPAFKKNFSCFDFTVAEFELIRHLSRRSVEGLISQDEFPYKCITDKMQHQWVWHLFHLPVVMPHSFIRKLFIYLHEMKNTIHGSALVTQLA